MSRIRVLVVDDSVVARRIVVEAMAEDPEIEVIGTAANGSIALTMVKLLEPDLVTMDMEMPVMDGIEAVRAMRRRGDRCRVIMFTTVRVSDAKRTFAALAAGANDFVTKPTSMIVGGPVIPYLTELLIPRIKALVPKAGPGEVSPTGAATADRPVISQASDRPMTLAEPGNSSGLIHLAARPPGLTRPVRAVVIGASMGGSTALLDVLRPISRLPVPVAVVQHMAPVFTQQLAQWLDGACSSTVQEAVGGEELQPGHVYVAPGGQHLELAGTVQGAHTVLGEGPLVNSSRPSVDLLFSSAVRAYGGDVLAVMLTGMGSDGLEGCRAVVEAGGTVLVQDEASSLVWGMPGAVAKAGYAHRVVPLSDIGAAIMAEVHGSRGRLAPSPEGT